MRFRASALTQAEIQRRIASAPNFLLWRFFEEFDMTSDNQKMDWVEPEIRDLDVQETNAFPRIGADVGGNPFPDCQRS